MIEIQYCKNFLSRWKVYFCLSLTFIFLTTFAVIGSQNINNYLTTKKENLIIARDYAEMRSTQLLSYLNMLSILYEKTISHYDSIPNLSSIHAPRAYKILSPGNNQPININYSLELLSYLSSSFATTTTKNKSLTDNFLLAVKEDFLAWHSSDQKNITEGMTDDNARGFIKSLHAISCNTISRYNACSTKKKGGIWVPLHDEIISGKHVVYNIAPVLINNQVTYIIGIRFQSIDIPYFFIKPKKNEAAFIISRDGGTAFGLEGDIYTAHKKKAILAILHSRIWKTDKSKNMQFHFVWPYVFTSAIIKKPQWSIVIVFSIWDILSRLIYQHGFSFMLSGLSVFLIWARIIYIDSRPQGDKPLLHNIEQSEDFFLAGITHEIRTPLHGALGNLELLRNEVNSPAAVARINVINNTMSSLMMLTNRILDHAKIEEDEFTLMHEPYDLTALLEQCLQTWAPLITRKKVALYFLPDDIVDVHCCGDSQRLSQIVLNLLSNAYKFTTHGAIIVRAHRTMNAEGQHRLQISVSDTGCGIPEDKQKAVFQSFVQNVAKHPHYTEGTGLGLALCQQLAGQMEGELFLESEIGIGSCFMLDIPLEEMSVRSDKPDTQQAEQPITLYCSSRLWEASLTRILSHWGMTVTSLDIHTLPSLHLVNKMVLIASTELPQLPSLTTTGRVIIHLTPDGPLVPETSGNFIRLTAFSMPALRELLRQQQATGRDISAVEEITRVSSQATPRLLVVDDNPVNLALIHKQLLTIGYSNVDFASSGEEAQTQLQASHYALIITDFYMPKLGGEGLVLWLRQHGLKTPVIAISAATVNSQRFDAILLKPVYLEQLKTTLNRFLPHSETALPYPDELLTDAKQLFANEWPAERGRIRIAIAQGDRQDFCHLMHRLKGSLLILGWYEHADFTDEICQYLRKSPQKSGENDWLTLSASLENMIKYIA